MAANNSQSETPSREVAKRVFATEFVDGTYTFQESDDERAPVYQLLPTGEKANRIFFVGTVTEINFVGENNNVLQARVVDPTGSVYVYAGEYQPEAERVLRDLEVPAYISIVGKPRVYDPEDSDEMYVSIRPETVIEVDKEVRDKWVVDTARLTLERIEMSDAESNPYARMASENYEEDISIYRDGVITALEDLDDAVVDSFTNTGESEPVDGSGEADELDQSGESESDSQDKPIGSETE